MCNTYKGFIVSLYNKLLQRNKKKTDNLLDEWRKDLNSHFTKEDTHVDNFENIPYIIIDEGEANETKKQMEPRGNSTTNL